MRFLLVSVAVVLSISQCTTEAHSLHSRLARSVELPESEHKNTLEDADISNVAHEDIGERAVRTYGYGGYGGFGHGRFGHGGFGHGGFGHGGFGHGGFGHGGFGHGGFGHGGFGHGGFGHGGFGHGFYG